MDRRQILDEIRRTADENGGKPLGMRKFRHETGIRESDWLGKYWARWGDALAEAGFQPNLMQDSFDDEVVLRKLAEYILEIERFPTVAELKLRRRSDESFPSNGVFARVGHKAEIARKLIQYCDDQDELQSVVQICKPIAAQKSKAASRRMEPQTTGEHGYVYLMKSGKYYKIGFTKSLDTRRYEIGMQLPKGIEPIHSIRTDDPAGIEACWHRRFKDKHMNGEWFQLTPQDVAAFKRRKFM